MTPRRHRDRKPTHPGELLREVVLPSLNRPKAEIARLLDISRERCPARPVHRLEEKMGSGWNDELFGETF